MLEIDQQGAFEGASHVNNTVPAPSATAVELPNRRSEPPTRWLWGRARSAAAVDASLHHWSAGASGQDAPAGGNSAWRPRVRCCPPIPFS